MAITSSISSTASAAANPITKKTKKTRTVLTSPFFKHNRVIRRVFSGAEPAPVGCYLEETKDPVTGKITKELKINPKPSSEMFASQKAMYIILTDIDRIRKRANQPVFMAESSQLYKRNFSGIFDSETQSLVGKMQNAFNHYYEDEEIDIQINVDNRIGPVTLDEMDKRLEMIKYYDSSNRPFIYHADYVCVDADYILKPHKDDTYLYMVPDRPVGNTDAYVKKRKGANGQPEQIKLVQYQTKIIILRDVNNFSEDWFYAKVLLKKPNSNEYYFEDGYISRLDLLPRLTSMPDPDAHLIKISATDPQHDSVYDIINQYYYTNTGNKNGFGMPLVHVKPSDPSTAEYQHYTCFKFYVNLLLYANNPEAVNSSVDAIYLKTAQPVDNAWLDTINGKGSYANSGVTRDAYYSNYQYFLKLVEHWRTGAHWEYSGTNTIVVKDNFHMWVPSKGFADRLYAVIEDKRDFLSILAGEAIAAIQTKWPRGFGVELDGTLAASFGFFTAEAGMKFKISRKHTATPEEVTLMIEKEGKLSGGVAVDIGVGLKLSAGQRRLDQDMPSGLQASAGAGALIGLALRTEYEFPIVVSDAEALGNDGAAQALVMRNDYVLWPLLMTFASAIPNPMELIGFEFLKGFIDYNLNPNNYLTKLSVTQDMSVYGQASIGFGLGDSHGEDLWESEPGDLLERRENNSWDIRNLAALLNLKLGASVNAQFALGFTYEATYDDFCFDKLFNKRIPMSLKLSVITNANLSQQVDLQIANLVVPIADYEPTASFELSITIDKMGNGFPSKNNLIDDDSPNVTLLAGHGNWSITNSSSTILGISLKKMTQVPQDINEFVSHIDYFTLKKRINIEKLKATAAIPVIAKKKAKNMRVSNMSISAGMESFYEVEFKIPSNVVNNMHDDLVKILQKTKHDLYDAIQNISWVSITTSIANNLTPTINTKLITADLRMLYNMLLRKFRYETIGRHGEMVFSAGLEAKFAVLAKISFELNGQVILSYDKSYMEEHQWRTLSPAVENIEGLRIKEYFEYPGVKEYLLGLS